MATFGAIKTAIQRRILDVNGLVVSVSDVAASINTAINFYKHEHFWFNEFEETVGLIAGDPHVPATSQDMLSEIDLKIEDDNSRFVLRKISPSAYDRRNVEGTGRPSVYTWRDGFEVYFYPDQAYDLIVHGIKDYADFPTDSSQDDTSNDFTTYADQLLMYEAAGRLLESNREDFPKADRFMQAAKREFDNLKSRTFSLTASGTLEVETL